MLAPQCRVPLLQFFYVIHYHYNFFRLFFSSFVFSSSSSILFCIHVLQVSCVRLWAKFYRTVRWPICRELNISIEREKMQSMQMGAYENIHTHTHSCTYCCYIFFLQQHKLDAITIIVIDHDDYNPVLTTFQCAHNFYNCFFSYLFCFFAHFLLLSPSLTYTHGLSFRKPDSCYTGPNKTETHNTTKITIFIIYMQCTKL